MQEGGSAGSWLGVRAYSEFGWAGIAGLTTLASAAALTRHLAHRRSAARPAAARPAAARPAAARPAAARQAGEAGSGTGTGTAGADRVSCR